ncbi:MAG TPA: histidine phosphatase family protein [Candidatus Paceibacterota bacterium]|nr:histidine phosphatase family protein [Candidatus Paceibacterota bacterium]
MKKIYFVRHGESDANAGGPLKPENEVSLTELGHEQAEFVGQRATKLGVDVIISSTLFRARQTAEHISQATGLPVETSDLLIERRYPSAGHGRTKDDPILKEILHALEVRFGEDDPKHSDEETFEEIKERVIKALEYLANRPEENILVVTHGITLRILVAVALFGPELTRREAGKIVNVFKTKNTGISYFEYDPELQPHAPWIVRTWNDHAHLG